MGAQHAEVEVDFQLGRALLLGCDFGEQMKGSANRPLCPK